MGTAPLRVFCLLPLPCHCRSQPDAGPLALFRVINPTCAAQWVTRRLSLRPDIYLFPTLLEPRPGDLTLKELDGLRTVITSAKGQACARSLGNKIQSGLDNHGHRARAARLVFDWCVHWWTSDSAPARLVSTLTPLLLREPHNYLSHVAKFPHEDEALPQTSRSRTNPYDFGLR